MRRDLRTNHSSRRRGVSGVLGAVILFAMLSVAGIGYLVFVNNVSQQVAQANAARQGAALLAGKESLALGVGLVGGTALVVSVNNTGGTPSVIDYIYVQDQSGKLIAPPGLMGLAGGTNATAVWPISLAPGQSTNSLYCVSGHRSCSVKLTGYTYTTGKSVMVEVVTKAGNTFSAPYPPSAPLVGQPNPLVVSLVATPAQVFSCSPPNCITVTATVYNYATGSVTNVQLNPNPPTPLVTGTLGVGVPGGSCGSPSPSSTIPGYSGVGNPSSITFTCTYSATTGPVGGFASFSGGAEGTLNGAAAASATAISNTIQIGGASNVPTQGAFAANYFFVKYSACQTGPTGSVGPPFTYSYSSPCNTSPSTMPPSNPNALTPGNYISGFSDYYVAYYVQVTNDFNATLPILEYSYLFSDPGISTEAYSFLVGTTTTPYYPNYCNGGGCLANNIPTLTAYTATPTTCINNPSQCIEVAPGQTVTLTFAACSWGSSNWVWGGTPYAESLDKPTGCLTTPPGYINSGTGQVEVPEGQTLSIVLSYLYKNNVYSQSMPFEGQTVTSQRTTSTALVCVPSTDPVNAPSTCTVTVTDLSSGTAVTPTGTVSISQIPLLGGTLSNGGTCSLSGSGSTATCTFTYTPSLGKEQADVLTASYPGDVKHSGSSGQTTINAVQRSTETSVVCNPTGTTVNTPTSCVVSVNDKSPGTAVVPTGSVTLSDSPVSSGTFSTGASCPLSGLNTSASTCSFTYTPNSGFLGSVKLTGSYPGDIPDHAASTGSATIKWARLTSTVVSCSPTSVALGSSTTCTVTVTDTSSGTPSTPTGTVQFTQGPTSTGTFTPSNGQCTLSGSGSTATCTVKFAPGSGQPPSVTITANYLGDTAHLSSSGQTTLTVTKLTPALATSFTPASPKAGQSVSDTATITGGYGPTGTVTFYDGFTSNSCTTGGTQVGSPVTISGGTATSSSLTFNVGTYYWDAVYSGDGNNNVVTSPCETLVVVKATPSISTTLSASTISPGTSVYDTSTLSSDSGSNTGGTVNYYYYSGGTCGGSGTLVSTVTVASGNVPNSASHTFNTAGTFSWNAVYSGDSNNQGPVTSTCEPLTVIAKNVQFVQQAAGMEESGPYTCSFVSQPNVGDLVIVSFTVTPNTGVTSVTDFGGKSLTLVSSVTQSGSAATLEAFMYEEVVPSGDTTSSPITITFSGGSPMAIVTCAEFSGVPSGTALQTKTGSGTTTSTTLTISASSMTPASNDLVYAYTGFTFCVNAGFDNAAVTGSSPFTSGSATLSGSSPLTGTWCSGSRHYRLNDGDQYMTSWASGSTTAGFTACGSGSSSCSSPSSGYGSSGWIEIVAEFDPPNSVAAGSASVQGTNQVVPTTSLTSSLLILGALSVCLGYTIYEKGNKAKGPGRPSVRTSEMNQYSGLVEGPSEGVRPFPLNSTRRSLNES